MVQVSFKVVVTPDEETEHDKLKVAEVLDVRIMLHVGFEQPELLLINAASTSEHTAELIDETDAVAGRLYSYGYVEETGTLLTETLHVAA